MQSAMNWNGNDVQYESDVQEIIITAFFHSQKFFIHGMILCTYFITWIGTVITGLGSYFERHVSDKLELNPYIFILPVCVVLYDFDLRRVY